jgi:hypothetical protein
MQEPAVFRQQITQIHDATDTRLCRRRSEISRSFDFKFDSIAAGCLRVHQVERHVNILHRGGQGIRAQGIGCDYFCTLPPSRFQHCTVASRDAYLQACEKQARRQVAANVTTRTEHQRLNFLVTFHFLAVAKSIIE